MGWGEDKPKQNPLTSCPGWRIQPVAGATGDQGWEGLAGPALHLALGAVLIVRGPSTPTAQACDPVAHVEQHHLQRVCIHAPLVGLGSALHVLHNSACEVFALRGGDSRYMGEVHMSGVYVWGTHTPGVWIYTCLSLCVHGRGNTHAGMCTGHPRPTHTPGHM